MYLRRHYLFSFAKCRCIKSACTNLFNHYNYINSFIGISVQLEITSVKNPIRIKLINMEKYKIPEQTKIGHVHLKVSDIKRSLEFYCNLLGFELTTMYGDQAA